MVSLISVFMVSLSTASVIYADENTFTCADDQDFIDEFGYDCSQWGGDFNNNGMIDCSMMDVIMECPDGGASGPDMVECEVGGFFDGEYYYSATFMDEVRNNCPLSCEICEESAVYQLGWTNYFSTWGGNPASAFGSTWTTIFFSWYITVTFYEGTFESAFASSDDDFIEELFDAECSVSQFVEIAQCVSASQIAGGEFLLNPSGEPRGDDDSNSCSVHNVITTDCYNDCYTQIDMCKWYKDQIDNGEIDCEWSDLDMCETEFGDSFVYQAGWTNYFSTWGGNPASAFGSTWTTIFFNWYITVTFYEGTFESAFASSDDDFFQELFDAECSVSEFGEIALCITESQIAGGEFKLNPSGEQRGDDDSNSCSVHNVVTRDCHNDCYTQIDMCRWYKDQIDNGDIDCEYSDMEECGKIVIIIVGVLAGAVVLLVALVVILCCCCKKKKQQNSTIIVTNP